MKRTIIKPITIIKISQNFTVYCIFFRIDPIIPPISPPTAIVIKSVLKIIQIASGPFISLII